MNFDGFTSSASLQALANLLSPNAKDEDFDSEQPQAFSSTSPEHIGQAKNAYSKGKGNQTEVVASEEKCVNESDIWTVEEVPEGSELDDLWDPREQPEYEIVFKQRVGTEDIFLGMSRRDVSTACCEDMLIKIKLQDTKLADITLDIRDKFLDLRTPKNKLGLFLPHPVDSKNGKAHFLSEKQILEITLPMQRDFDFINFA
ncbi:protein PIH1D3 [Rhinatrema bivittatum]|uniref:protein PIH1D3 n=1 Tax=Rhinatrema bivittatum TaxID=194408 RepID=UPI001128292B|nr:protein PIH1D3 [Rhinatrema bivittatum]XP_029463205.1 protein PIH1D3 [Rhinatrema bivittatum]XP_029463206.1 protein PIH1D3 [Rhinatrema bivittatum]XP_029463207.1 protein PIH1D3 [Rhinatrema bivittatum]